MPCKAYSDKFYLFLEQQDDSLAKDFFSHLDACSVCRQDYKEYSNLEGEVRDLFRREKRKQKSISHFSPERFSVRLINTLQEDCNRVKKGRAAFLNRSIQAACRFFSGLDFSNSNKIHYKLQDKLQNFSFRTLLYVFSVFSLFILLFLYISKYKAATSFLSNHFASGPAEIRHLSALSSLSLYRMNREMLLNRQILKKISLSASIQKPFKVNLERFAKFMKREMIRNTVSTSIKKNITENVTMTFNKSGFTSSVIYSRVDSYSFPNSKSSKQRMLSYSKIKYVKSNQYGVESYIQGINKAYRNFILMKSLPNSYYTETQSLSAFFHCLETDAGAANSVSQKVYALQSNRGQLTKKCLSYLIKNNKNSGQNKKSLKLLSSYP